MEPDPDLQALDSQTGRAPATAAGRALQHEYPGVWWWLDERWNGPLGAAIEAEAVARIERPKADPDAAALAEAMRDLADIEGDTVSFAFDGPASVDHLAQALVNRLRAAPAEPIPEGHVRDYGTGAILPDTRDHEGHPFRVTDLAAAEGPEPVDPVREHFEEWGVHMCDAAHLGAGQSAGALRADGLPAYAGALEGIIRSLPGGPVVNGVQMTNDEAIRDLRARFHVEDAVVDQAALSARITHDDPAALAAKPEAGIGKPRHSGGPKNDQGIPL